MPDDIDKYITKCYHKIESLYGRTIKIYSEEIWYEDHEGTNSKRSH